MKRAFLIFMALISMVSAPSSVCAVSVDSATQPERLEVSSVLSGETMETTYTDYLNGAQKGSAGTTALQWIPEKKEITAGETLAFELEVPEAAGYHLTLTYQSLKSQDAAFCLLVDGEAPFSEAKNLLFPSIWRNAENSPRTDQNGNQYAPDQELYEGTVSRPALDTLGRYEHPYLFFFTSGTHQIQLQMTQGALRLKALTFSIPDSPGAYEKPEASGAVGNPVVIEGEWADIKTKQSLIPLSDSASAAVSPQDAQAKQLNYIGGTGWSEPGAALTWNFTVPETGYYTLGFHFRQNENLGGSSFRRLEIDGKLPFSEADRIRFAYGASWQYMTWGGEDGELYRIFLEAGEHTLTLTATAGPVAEVYTLKRQLTADMGNLYVDITMLVGETVDRNRSYELFRQIPQFNERLDAIISSLELVIQQLKSIQKIKTGTNVSTLEAALQTVRTMRAKPYSAHRYKSDYYDAYTNLSALMGSMTSMPLELDRIVLADNADEVALFPSFVEKLLFSAKRFITTFVEDYRSFQGEEGQDGGVKIWIMQGRDQAQALNMIVQDGFTRDTGIPVQIELVNATLIQAMLSGSGPDCLLQMSRTEPVNLAMREALVDLSQFGDLDEVLARFTDGAQLPYRYNGGLYALPDTQSFFVMFLRTDILKALGIEQPETWDDFLNAAMLLQRQNLQVSMPSITDSGISNTGVGNMSLYPTLLVQNGLPLYREDLSGTLLDQTAQTQVFSDWIKWYTRYKLPVVTDFFNRFRIGSAPIGIASFGLYTQLKTAAPEIADRWIAAPIPGTVQADGSVNRASAASGSGCAITKLAKSKENAWAFLKWWTSAGTQLKYSEKLESLLGPTGRVMSANTQAVASMDWDASMLAVLQEAQTTVTEIPEVPGGYYTARGIYQAYWGVIEQGAEPADQLSKWSAIVNREITRKTQEYANR